jgi:hypothetical protein
MTVVLQTQSSEFVIATNEGKERRRHIEARKRRVICQYGEA